MICTTQQRRHSPLAHTRIFLLAACAGHSAACTGRNGGSSRPQLLFLGRKSAALSPSEATPPGLAEATLFSQLAACQIKFLRISAKVQSLECEWCGRGRSRGKWAGNRIDRRRRPASLSETFRSTGLARGVPRAGAGDAIFNC